MWSVGCIFAEILQRKPFIPAMRNQIQVICEYVGTPDIEKLQHIPEEGKQLIKSIQKSNKNRNGKDFTKIFPTAS